MASSAPARTSPLQPADWLRVASLRLASDGVESVRVELLARDLGVSKGSFYWHFRDRDDLLSQLLGKWENEEVGWIEAAVTGIHSPPSRWARFVRHCSSPEHLRLEAGIRSWARKEPGVAFRVSTIEKRRASYLEGILGEIGFAPPAASQWSELALLTYLGWVDRASRDPEFHNSGPALSELLSDMILAASAKSNSFGG
ncbi:MAG TPA: TetR/AcrR family transcriptional regulator [Candidatus Acidoferrum sp.]|nr:TetR/AcrR family transcriptional regulator [Candidatus Acidoferrum sp.]